MPLRESVLRFLRLSGLALALAAPGVEALEPPRSLVVISLDTLRRDHLEVYGYPRPTSPEIGRWAAGSVVFDRAFAQDTNTNPSHASMFTGVYPHVHGSRANGDVLAAGEVTLAQILRRAGFRTAAFVSGATMRSRATGLDRGFDTYDDRFEGYRRPAGETIERALAWLDGRARDGAGDRAGGRYFLFVHLFDCHGPYDPGDRLDLFRSRDPGPRLALRQIPVYQRDGAADEDVPRDLSAYVDRYDASIRATDDLVRRILDRLDLSETVVVLLADHGETLGERYWKLDHGGQVFDEQIRIPLVIGAPGLQARRVDALVETVDLLPTLAELLAVEVPAERKLQGDSLVPLLRGEDGGSTTVLASARASARRHRDRRYTLDRERRIEAVRSERWKLVRYPGHAADYVELYDLAADPGERTDVGDRYPDVRARYLELLDDLLADGGEVSPPPELDPELLEQLKSLGYID